MFLTVAMIRANDDTGQAIRVFADCGKTHASVRIFRSYGTPHSLKSLRCRSEIGGQDSVFQSSGIGVARLALFDDLAFAHDDDPVGASKANKFINMINFPVYLDRNCAEY